MATTSPRATTWLVLAVVAMSAAVLSFAALRSLAMLAGTPEHLAWLFPINLDATMVVATRMWVGVDVNDRARRFARVVALATIALSVAGNAGQHALVGGGAWWPVVVGAVPALVLAAVAHLVALATQQPTPTTPAAPLATVTIQPAEPVDQPATSDHQPTTEPDVAVAENDHQPVTTTEADASQPATDQPGDLLERARRLVADADGPVGRTVLKRELGITDHRARQLKRQLDQERRPALHAVAGS